MAKEEIIIRNEALRKTALFTIGALDLEKPWKVTIERETKRRTNSQLRLNFMWIDRVVKIVHEHTGMDKPAIHQHFKELFLEPHRTEWGGKVSTYWTTDGLSAKKMGEYLDKICGWCAAEGYFLPSPQDMGRERAA